MVMALSQANICAIYTQVDTKIFMSIWQIDKGAFSLHQHASSLAISPRPDVNPVPAGWGHCLCDSTRGYLRITPIDMDEKLSLIRVHYM